MSGSPRMPRVNEMLRVVIAEEIRALKDPEVGFVTVTGVDTSPDLRSAVVFYTALGTEEEQAATARALKRAAPHLRSRMGAQIHIKYTPALEFRVDAAIETGLRIEQLVRDLGTHDA